MRGVDAVGDDRTERCGLACAALGLHQHVRTEAAQRHHGQLHGRRRNEPRRQQPLLHGLLQGGTELSLVMSLAWGSYSGTGGWGVRGAAVVDVSTAAAPRWADSAALEVG